MIRTSLEDQRLFLICSTNANSSTNPPKLPSFSQFFPVLLFFPIIRPPHNPFHAMCVRWKWGLSISLGLGWIDQWMEDRETPVWSLHWAEITSPVGGCKMQLSPGRHQTGLTGGFSNLAIVSEGLFFGLLSHYAVMVAIFCFGIWIFFFFLGGETHARKFLNQASLTTNL